ncbi:MAG: hypothetical protein J2P17_04170 [Mycobacterium sp.]|nr:hypothetical protein [Mycobacterium sp.]
MALPELDVARVRRWCRERVPAHARDEVRVEADIGSRHVTVVECRPPWREDVEQLLAEIDRDPTAIFWG